MDTLRRKVDENICGGTLYASLMPFFSHDFYLLPLRLPGAGCLWVFLAPADVDLNLFKGSISSLSLKRASSKESIILSSTDGEASFSWFQMTFYNIGRVCAGERIGGEKVKVVTLELSTSTFTFLSLVVNKALVPSKMGLRFTLLSV